MNGRIFTFETDGKHVLGFDTGLDARSFAQAKLAMFMTQPGFIVLPSGAIETWQSGGVREYAVPCESAAGQESAPEKKTMIIWGPPFRGERLLEIINAPDRKDAALSAIRFWLNARTLLERTLFERTFFERTLNPRAAVEPPPAERAKAEIKPGVERGAPFPGPAGALIVTDDENAYPKGTVFFPPARLLKRSLEAEGASALIEAERFFHPDLEGDKEISFSAGAMLYRVFSGSPPFSGDKSEELRQDIREGNFIPPELAAPGLQPEMAALISHALKGGDLKTGGKNAPAQRTPVITPDAILGVINARADAVNDAAFQDAASWIKPLNEDETAKILAQQEQYRKKKNLAVKSRRFVIRNTAVIAGIFIALAAVMFVIMEIARSRADLPTTLGMTPAKVAETYYTAFSALDHVTMEACVRGGAGKNDINTVSNLFVMHKVRMAYEQTDPFISAEEWLARGRPETEKTVFGITGLTIKAVSGDAERARIEAEYVLWIPGGSTPDREGSGLTVKDTLTLEFEKDASARKDAAHDGAVQGRWRITDISRSPAM